MIRTEQFTLNSEGRFHCFNVTDTVRSVIQASGIREGSALVYYRHTTGGVIIIEHEAGLLVDLEGVLEGVAPGAGEYKHHLRGYDFNGSAHIRSALLGVSAVVPVLDGELLIGGFQEILIVDMEPQGKPRAYVVQVTGE